MTDVSRGESILTIYVCDDIEEHGKQLSDVLLGLSKEFPLEVKLFSAADKMMQELRSLQEQQAPSPDLILLDIRLSQVDGVTLGKKIKQMHSETFLVFVTAYAEYAVKGYEANAFRYLLKPITEEVVRNLLVDMKVESSKQKKMSVKTKNGEIMISLRDLIYISAEDKYTVLYTKTSHYISDLSLTRYEEQLTGYGFFRIHRKYLVNMYHHRGIQAGKVLLHNDCGLPISKKRLADYQSELFRYFGEDLI